MFDTQKTGEIIAQHRRQKNMTQMELAEEMSVSFQAVSSWERGNSMPDISRLPQLCSILGISIDQLLGDNPYLPTVHQLLEPQQNNAIPAQHLIDLEPAIKPRDLSEMIHQNREGMLFESFDQLLQLIPFLTQEDAEALVHAHRPLIASLDDFAMIAPMLPAKLVLEIVDQLPMENVSSTTCLLLAPFIGPERMQRLLEQSPAVFESGETVAQLAPFVARDYLHRILSQRQFSFSQEEFFLLAPFVEQPLLQQMLEQSSAAQPLSAKALAQFAPFLSPEFLHVMLKKCH